MGLKEGIFLLKNHQIEQSGDKFDSGRNVIIQSGLFYRIPRFPFSLNDVRLRRSREDDEQGGRKSTS